MKKKLVLAALAFVLLSVPAAWLQLRDGVVLGESFYIQRNPDLYSAGEDSIAIDRNGNDAEFTISVNDMVMKVWMETDGRHYSFCYEDGTVVEGFAGQWADELVNGDGMPLGWTDGIAVYVGETPPEDVLFRKYSLSNGLFRMYAGICEQKGHVLMIVMGLLLYALGIASILWPEQVHFFGSRWRYAHAELSADGIAMQKLSGIACVVLSIVLMYMPLFR